MMSEASDTGANSEADHATKGATNDGTIGKGAVAPARLAHAQKAILVRMSIRHLSIDTLKCPAES